jgi:hypothetical protein
MADPTLKASLGLDSTAFERGLTQAAESGQKFRQQWTRIASGLGFGAALAGGLRVIQNIADSARDIETNMLASGRAVDANTAAASRLATQMDAIAEAGKSALAQGVGLIARYGEFLGGIWARVFFGGDQVRAAEASEKAAADAVVRLEQARKLAAARAEIEKQAAAARERDDAAAAKILERRAALILSAERERMSSAQRLVSIESEIAEITDSASKGTVQDAEDSLRLAELRIQREKTVAEIQKEADDARESAMKEFLADMNRNFDMQRSILDVITAQAQVQKDMIARAKQLDQEKAGVGIMSTPLNIYDYAAGAGGNGYKGKAQRVIDDFERADQIEARGGTNAAERANRVRERARRRSEEIPGIRSQNEAERGRIDEQLKVLRDQYKAATDLIDIQKRALNELTGANAE